MADTNYCSFTGTATNIRAINTRTGRPMTIFNLVCNKEVVKAVCFNGLATAALQMDNGDHVELAGQLQISDQYGAQIILKELNGQTGRQPEQERLFDDQQPGPDLSRFDYRGGPF